MYIRAGYDYFTGLRPVADCFVISNIGAQVVAVYLTITDRVRCAIPCFPIGSAVTGYVQNQSHTIFFIISIRYIVMNRHLAVLILITGGILFVCSIHISDAEIVIDVVVLLLPYSTRQHMTVGIGRCNTGLHCCACT